ncbi:hypothetical protein [Thalassospira povalilytica]|uniref:TIR domain-containing protein n=1 Tax=Thalassospira povalilytica TaxID=732237 RepID=A0A8I1M824_9PROT|nr:hypothetical protein [Thalassospira povalilytica]MBN8196861.1 hypothetical protein [Thalassospira povalilytica]
MLPPVLEIFVVWHPKDAAGASLAQTIFDHFMHGPTFSGVIGGGIQVSLRSAGWNSADDSPRPIYAEGLHNPNGMSPAKFVAVVPLLGTEMAATVENTKSVWHNFVNTIRDLQLATPNHFGVFPYLLSGNATNDTEVSRILGAYQFLAASKPDTDGEDVSSMLCRDLTQGITQLISPDAVNRLTAFISHTKRHSHTEGEDVDALVGLVREVISQTRLNDFFDANDLQPGRDWDRELKEKSGTSAMLAIRTDLYSSREWCQREISIAKTHGMPVVMIDAIGFGEERGSFLMDHVPRIAARKSDGCWRNKDVYRALNLLVDECLKRALWLQQKELGKERPELDVAWWAPHAPEPLTLSHWINGYLEGEHDGEGDIRILHPDPPLGPEERQVLVTYAKNTKLERGIDIMTPRQLATRGG